MIDLLVATSGGHLAQLWELAPRLPEPGERLWITDPTAQSRSLLTDDAVIWVPEVQSRDVLGVLRELRRARRLRHKLALRRVVSTGSALALGYLPYLAATGVPAHYIESAARVDGPSVTGRILRHVPRVHLYTQHPGWADRHWGYAGSVLEGFRATTRARPVQIRHAVVTVGTMTAYPFRRFVARAAELLGPGGELERAQGQRVQVLWQTGPTPLDGLHIDATPFVPGRELLDAMATADLVVSHAGGGSALDSLRAGRCPVLVPRSAQYGENNDEHQTQIAAGLARRGLAVSATPSALTLDHLWQAASIRIDAVPNPEPLRLAGSGA